MRKLLIVAVVALLLSACADTPLLQYIKAMQAWDPAYTYSLGDATVQNAQGYESLQDGNTGHDPSVSPTWWN